MLFAKWQQGNNVGSSVQLFIMLEAMLSENFLYQPACLLCVLALVRVSCLMLLQRWVCRRG